MGAVVIGVVFLAGFIGVPSLFGHGDAHAKPQVTQQAATAPAPAPAQIAEVDTGAATAYTRAAERP